MEEAIKIKIKEYWKSKEVCNVNINEEYERFRSKFGIDKIKSFSPEECLYKIFGNKDNDSLVYNIEFKYKYFASTKGGPKTSVYNLFYKQDVNDKGWKYYPTGNINSGKNVTEAEAKTIATKYRDSLVTFFEYIDNARKSKNRFTKENFQNIDIKAKEILGELYGKNGKTWIKKYCHMLFPDIFASFYSDKWIDNVFKVTGLKPDNSFMAMCFQFASLAKEFEIPIAHLARILDRIRLDEISKEGSKSNMHDNSTLNEKENFANAGLNIILYGPPGTGKTYSTYKKAVEIVTGKSIDDSVPFDKIKKEFEKYKNNKNQQIEFITFHQSYSYEDFIEGYKPDEGKKNSNNIVYKRKDGIFKKFCDNARKEENANLNYCFIIDEINRGNVSKIFGELITLIEESKRFGNKEALSCTLTYSQEPFDIPKNVYIIGTMNTADRSLVQLDAALRRRFKFEEMMPNCELLNKEVGTVEGINIAEMLKTINKRISIYRDREHQIGHTYFLKLKEDKSLEKLNYIFFKEIIPLLQEYFFDEYDRISLILNDSKDKLFVTQENIDGRILYNIQEHLEKITAKEYINIYNLNNNNETNDS